MDDQWENEVTQYGAVNITGFRIMDYSRQVVREVMEGLKKENARFKGTISVRVYSHVVFILSLLSFAKLI